MSRVPTNTSRRDEPRRTSNRDRTSQARATAQDRRAGTQANDGRQVTAPRSARDEPSGHRTAQRTAPYTRQQTGGQGDRPPASQAGGSGNRTRNQQTRESDYPPVSQLGASRDRSANQASRANGATRRTARPSVAPGTAQPSQAGSVRGTARGSRAGTGAPPPEPTPDLAGAIYLGDDEDDYDEYDDEYYEVDEANYRAITDEYCGPPKCNCFPSPSNGRLPSMMYDGIKCKHKSKYNMAGMSQKHSRFFHDNWGPPKYSQEPDSVTNPPYKKFADYERAHRMVKASAYFKQPPPKTPEPEEEEYYDEEDEMHDDNPRSRQGASRTVTADRRAAAPTAAPRRTARQTAVPTRGIEPSRQATRDDVAEKERELERKLNLHKNQSDTMRGKIYDPVTKKMIVYSVSHKNEEENFYPGQR